MKRLLILALALIAIGGTLAIGQNVTPNGVVVIQPSAAQYYKIPLSATAAINTVTTWATPTPPPGLYAYVCDLTLEVSQDATGTALTNAATTNNNFGTFAFKFSMVGTVNTDLVLRGLVGDPGTGCTKSVLPGTLTSFVSPQTAHATYSFYGSYYFAP